MLRVHCCIFFLLGLAGVVIGRLCSEPATDVIFLIDDTGSLKYEEFHMELDFVAAMSMEFNLGPLNYQVGTYTFSEDAQPNIRLGEITDHTILATKIKQIPYRGGFTFLGKSLKTVHEGFSLAAGGRKNVRKALIILTDGNTVDIKETAESVKLLRQSDVQVYAIAFGSSADVKLARSLVAKSSDLFQVSLVSDLSSIIDAVKRTVCIDEIPVCGVHPMDIVFVLDESFSIKLDQFIWLRYFVSRFVRNSKIGPQNAQISVIAFADKVRNVFSLNTFMYKDDVATEIHKLQRLGGTTYTNLALNFVRTQSFTKKNGGRPGARKVVVVLTDGQSLIPEETFKEAQGLHDMGARVFVIGVGQDVSMDELKKVASKQDDVFFVSSFEVLSEIEKDFRFKVCKNP